MRQVTQKLESSPEFVIDWVEPLSEREAEILRLLADCLSNQEIADAAEVSRNTVKFHLKNIYSKLGINNRLQAVVAARDSGFA